MLSLERCPGLEEVEPEEVEPEEVQEQRECAGGGGAEQPGEGPELDIEMS